VSKHVLIVGAGPGLGLENARRFGEAGYAVHLIARNRERLDQLAGTLAEAGIEADVSVVDVADGAALAEVVEELDRRRPIDLCIVQPGAPAADALVDVLKLTVDDISPYLASQVNGAIGVGQALVPRMTQRGEGTILFVGGASGRLTLRGFGNIGPAMAAVRNYALTLSGALDQDDTDVYAAFYAIGGMIGSGPGELEAAPLAERLHQLSVDKDARELLITPEGEHVPKGAGR
jgi:NADP-dependent 3-hydroxy acid dehydrogenase YdfG